MREGQEKIVFRYPTYNIVSNVIALVLIFLAVVGMAFYLAKDVQAEAGFSQYTLGNASLLLLFFMAFRDALIFPYHIQISKAGVTTRSPLFSFREEEIPWDAILKIEQFENSRLPARNGLVLRIDPRLISNPLAFLLTPARYRGILINGAYENHQSLYQLIRSKVESKS